MARAPATQPPALTRERNNISLQNDSAAALAPLVGQPIWDAWRALDMEMFDIGERIGVVNRRQETVEVGTYRLHVQSPWRIVGRKGLLVGSCDVHDPPSDHDPDSSFDAGRDRSACEERVRMWLDAHQADPLIIEAVNTDAWGGFELVLSHESRLQVFPASSRHDVEHWRLIGPGADHPPHFVVCGQTAEWLT